MFLYLGFISTYLVNEKVLNKTANPETAETVIKPVNGTVPKTADNTNPQANTSTDNQATGSDNQAPKTNNPTNGTSTETQKPTSTPSQPPSTQQQNNYTPTCYQSSIASSKALMEQYVRSAYSNSSNAVYYYRQRNPDATDTQINNYAQEVRNSENKTLAYYLSQANASLAGVNCPPLTGNYSI